MRRVLISLGVLSVVAIGVVAGAWHWLVSDYETVGPLSEPTTLIIPKGTGENAIAEALRGGGIIDDIRLFKLSRRLLAAPDSLRAGEYAFPAGVSVAAAIGILQSGKTIVRRVTIAEGLTNAEIVNLLNKTPGLSGLAGPLPGEGRLLPETYHFSYGDRREELVRRMARSASEVLAVLWRKRASGLALQTPAQALILASIVEKETGKDGERARVAAVFHNRLKKGMRLQSDPTVIYGITQGQGALGRPITKSDLKTPTPYNTYVIKGLPPTPIANSGRAAIEAVLNPATTKALYFVADGSGGHAFAETLSEHNRNVAKWRKIEKARRQKVQ